MEFQIHRQRQMPPPIERVIISLTKQEALYLLEICQTQKDYFSSFNPRGVLLSELELNLKQVY